MGLLKKRKLIAGSLRLIVFVLAAPLLLWLGVLAGFFGPVPGAEELKKIRNSLSSEVYSADGKLLGKYYLYDRTPVDYDALPAHVVNALIATEDVRFYEHSGIDYRSLVRVLVRTILLQQKEAGGGSTLTQQLAKNLFPRENHGLFSLPVNKIREMIIAQRLEKVYDKKQIIALYLNTVPFGDSVYGIESASRRFFNVGTRDLAVEQSAVLIGMLKGSYMYNPRVFPDRAMQRRNVVIQQMYKYGYLTAEKAASIKKLPIALQYTRLDTNEGPATYFREHLKKDLLEWCKNNKNDDGENYNLYTDGLKIYTTIDAGMQLMAEKATGEHLTKLQAEFEKEWGKRAPWLTDSALIKAAIMRAPVYRGLTSQGLSWQQALDSMRQPKKMELFAWGGDKQSNASSLDSLLYYLKFLQAGFLAINPSDGAVKAWVGGINHEYFKFDHVNTRTRRQVGSTFKPIVYAAALENGVKPCRYFSASQVTYTDLENWSPSNNDENYDSRYSLKGALTHSVNTVSVKVIEETGISPVIELAEALNITSKLPEVASLALGTAEISVTELAGAYAAFINRGRPVKPFYLAKITDRNGKVLAEFQPEELPQAFSEATGLMMLEMMKSVVDDGTARRLRWKYGITSDVAGKTGTTQNNRDGWFVGMLPGLVTVTWVGADDPRVYFKSTALGQGGSSALPVFASLVNQMKNDKNLAAYTKMEFPEVPSSIVRRLNCEDSKEGQGFFTELFNNKNKERKKEFDGNEKGVLGKLKSLFKKNE